jgi:hypothetical protein
MAPNSKNNDTIEPFKAICSFRDIIISIISLHNNSIVNTIREKINSIKTICNKINWYFTHVHVINIIAILEEIGNFLDGRSFYSNEISSQNIRYALDIANIVLSY